MTKYFDHAKGGLAVAAAFALILLGGIIEGHLQYGIAPANASSVPTTALAADHSTTSTTSK